MKTFRPRTKDDLKSEVTRAIKEHDNTVDLNYIDTALVTDMSELFSYSKFNGNISTWDMSRVTNTSFMFYNATTFNSDISNWDVSNVNNTSWMFSNCQSFNQDLSNWDVSNVTDMTSMFGKCYVFNSDISNWDVSNVLRMAFFSILRKIV